MPKQIKDSSASKRAAVMQQPLKLATSKKKKKPARAPQHIVPLAGVARGKRSDTGPAPIPLAAARHRVKLNKRKDGTISGISKMPPRPTSNLRTGQGQHETAYVVHERTMTNAVTDSTPKEAAAGLADVMGQWLELPKLRVANPQNAWLRTPLKQAQERFTFLSTSADADEMEVQKELEGSIPTVLSLRNKVPGSAVSKKGTKGHGEAKPSGDLQAMEAKLRNDETLDLAVNGETAVTLAWNLLDIGSPSRPADKIADSIETHMRALQTGYPRVFDWLSTDPAYHLLPWLIRNRARNFLARRSADELRAIFTQVYTNMGFSVDLSVLGRLT